MGTFADRFYEHIHSHPNAIIKKTKSYFNKKTFFEHKVIIKE